MHRPTALVATVALTAALLRLSAGTPVSDASGGAAAAAAAASNDVPSSRVIRETELVQKLNAKCGARDASGCVMLKMMTYMDKLMKRDSVRLGDVAEIARRDDPAAADPADDEPASQAGRARTDESDFGDVMADKLWRYVRSRALVVKVLPEADFVVSASPERDGSLDFGVSFRSGKDLESGKRSPPDPGPTRPRSATECGERGEVGVPWRTGFFF